MSSAMPWGESMFVVRVELTQIDALHAAADEALRWWQDSYPRDARGDPLDAEVHRGTTHVGGLPVSIVEIANVGDSWDGWDYAEELRQAPRWRFGPASVAKSVAAGSWWVAEQEVTQMRELVDGWHRLAETVPFPAAAARQIQAHLEELRALLRGWGGHRASLAVASPPGWPVPARTTPAQWQHLAELAVDLAAENTRRHEHHGHGKSWEPAVELSVTADLRLECVWWSYQFADLAASLPTSPRPGGELLDTLEDVLARARRATTGLPEHRGSRAWPRFPAALWHQAGTWLAATATLLDSHAGQPVDSARVDLCLGPDDDVAIQLDQPLRADATPVEHAERTELTEEPFWNGHWSAADTLAQLRRIHDIVATETHA